MSKNSNYNFGSKGAFIVPFSIPGCTSNLSLYVVGESINGKEDDLSALGANFSSFRDVDIRVKNNKMSIEIDHSSVFETSINKSIGRVVGLRIKSVGVVEVKNLRLVNRQGQHVIEF